ncbi:hypothetical protein G9A89_008336 [Geosiphon pyriformis]|nr:hypothetical protein G9A89_008336 [Geosiphon pyriformis]
MLNYRCYRNWEINQTIERYIQQQFPITYIDKDKGRLQTPAKKTRVKLLTNLSYYYTLGSTINISLADTFTSNMTSTFGQFLFQSKQRRAELLKPYGKYFEGFKSRSPMPSKFQLPLLQPDFGTMKEEESEDQEFNYQNPITKNPEENLPPEIVINQQPIDPIAEQLQQLPIPPQPLPLQPPQQPNVDPMAYAPIAKLEKFTGKENNAQNNARALQAIPYFLQDTTNSWYQRYFSNNNSINRLTNIFTTIKQRETETVTTYLEYFYRNLCQIQAIQADYFTAPQILNQFIHRLHNFKAAELEANHAQVINLVMNRLFELDSKLKQFDSIDQKLEKYLANNQAVKNRKPIIRKPVLKTQLQISSSESILKSGSISTLLHPNDTTTNLLTTHISSSNLSVNNTHHISTTIPTYLSATASSNLSIPTNSNIIPKLTSKQNSKTKTDTTKLEINLGTKYTQNLNAQHYLSLLVIPEDTSPNNWKPNQDKLPTSNIPSATIMEDKSLAAIFFFEIEEPLETLLFNRAALEKKPITTMYTDAKINGYSIKLILDSGLAGSIITKQLIDQLSYQVNQTASARIITTDGTTKIPIGKIDDLSIKVNGIIVPIKILVMEATQYQALMSNDWLSKINAMLD